MTATPSRDSAVSSLEAIQARRAALREWGDWQQGATDLSDIRVTEFIALAPADVDWLLSQVEQLQEENRTLREENTTRACIIHTLRGKLITRPSTDPDNDAFREHLLDVITQGFAK